MPTLRDIFDWFAIQQQNQQHEMLRQNLMDIARQRMAQKMGASGFLTSEQAPYGHAFNYTDSLPFQLSDRIFYQAPGLYDQLYNKNQADQTPLRTMFAPAKPYQGLL